MPEPTSTTIVTPERLAMLTPYPGPSSPLSPAQHAAVRAAYADGDAVGAYLSATYPGPSRSRTPIVAERSDRPASDPHEAKP